MKHFSTKRRVAPIGAAVALVAGVFCPLRAYAAQSYTITFTAADGHSVSENAGHPGEIIIDGSNFTTISGTNAVGSTSCTGTSQCVITVTHTDGTSDAPATELSYGQTTAFSLKNGETVISAGASFSGNTNISIVDYIAPQEPGNNDPQEPGNNDPQEPGQPQFDGKAYLFWECGKSRLCYHYFDNIKTDDTTTYYDAANITDDLDNTIKFNPATANSSNAGYSLKNDWEDFIAEHTTFGMEDVVRVVDLNPVDSPEGNNSFTHFGDRNFKVTIKNNDFIGITIGSWENLTYVPSFWDALSTPDLIDMSGTTVSNPAIVNTVLVEPTIKLRAGDGTNVIPITNIKPVRTLPNDALTSTCIDGECTLTFKTKYYDREVFEVTTPKGKYYIRIARIAVTGDIPTMRPGITDHTAQVTVYHPTSFVCDDFDVTLKIIYSGSKAPKTVTATPVASFEDELGNPINGCQTDGGKGLKKSYYSYHIGSLTDVKGFYINVSKKDENATTFGGNFAGSGQGTFYSLETRRTDWTK